MAPEEVSNYFGKEIDWWHLGVIVYEALMGSNPFSGTSEQVVIHHLVTKGIEIPEQLPKKYQTLLRGLLTREKSKRWGYEQIKAWLDGIEDIPVYYEYQPEISVDTSETDLKRWHREGFTEQSAKLWANLGLTIEEAKEFKEYFNYADAVEWVRAGFRSGKAAYKWYETGVETEETVLYENFGINPKQAARLKKEGVAAYELSKFLAAEELFEWKNLGISDVKEVVMLKRKGLGLDDVKKWKENGFELGKLIDYLSLDFGFQEAIEWRSLGFEAKKASIWRKYFSDANTAFMWMEIGFEPDEAKEFSSLDFEVSEALEWKLRGFTPEEAATWKEAGCSFEQAEAFKDKMGPSDARKLIKLERLLRVDVICFIILFLIVIADRNVEDIVVYFTFLQFLLVIVKMIRFFLNRNLKTYVADLVISVLIITITLLSLVFIAFSK